MPGYLSTDEKPPKKLYKRKPANHIEKVKNIRKLAMIEAVPPMRLAKKRTFSLILLQIAISGVGTMLTLYFLQQNRALIDPFVQMYTNKVNNYVYGDADEHCRVPLPTNEILLNLHWNVVGQQQRTWESLGNALNNSNRTRSVALIGGVGVGKTLSASIIQSFWPWPSNTVHMTWIQAEQNTDMDTAAEHIKSYLQQRLINCGQNLIVIDDIIESGGGGSIAMLSQLDAIIRKEFNEHFQMFILYLVTVPTYTADDLFKYDERIAASMKMKGLDSVIPFSKIDAIGLRECFRLEAQRMNVNELDEGQLNDAIIGIDSHRSGCKHISARVSLI